MDRRCGNLQIIAVHHVHFPILVHHLSTVATALLLQAIRAEELCQWFRAAAVHWHIRTHQLHNPQCIFGCHVQLFVAGYRADRFQLDILRKNCRHDCYSIIRAGIYIQDNFSCHNYTSFIRALFLSAVSLTVRTKEITVKRTTVHTYGNMEISSEGSLPICI